MKKKLICMVMTMLLTTVITGTSFAGFSEGSHIVQPEPKPQDNVIVLFGFSEGSH